LNIFIPKKFKLLIIIQFCWFLFFLLFLTRLNFTYLLLFLLFSSILLPAIIFIKAWTIYKIAASSRIVEASLADFLSGCFLGHFNNKIFLLINLLCLFLFIVVLFFDLFCLFLNYFHLSCLFFSITVFYKHQIYSILQIILV